MPLSVNAIKNAKPRAKQWKLFDERGLYVLVTPNGSKLWQHKYRFHGKENKIAYGPFPDVGLQEARRKRDDTRALLAQDIDPQRHKRAAKVAAIMAASNTFAAVANEYISKQERDGRAKRTIDKARWYLSLFEPRIGKVPVNELTHLELREVLEKVQNAGNVETAHRLRSLADRIIRYAIAVGYAKENPAEHLGAVLLTKRAKNHPAVIDEMQVGKLLRAIDGYTGYPSTHAALKLSPHLFQRPGEIRQMKWSDLDLDGGKWTLNAAETKMRRDHEVPLSRQAVEIIRSMEDVSGGGNYVFPAFHTRKRPLSENTINQALRRLGYAGVMTAHGFRSTASTLLNASGMWRSDVIERALAHKDTNGVRAVYNRSTYWEERAKMMQWWSDELDRLKAEAGP